MVSKAIMHMLIENSVLGNQTMWYQLSCCLQYKDASLCEIYEVTGKVVEDKLAYCEEPLEC